MTPALLDPDIRKSLMTLSRETADTVARHLVMAGRLLDDDPQQALVHARAAGSLAGRVADVREATGIAAYTAGEWAEALSELRAARRISGSPEQLAVMADCERALGRPERALVALDDPDVSRLEQATRVELVIVVAGARRDLGQAGAAVLLLQGPAKATTARRPWAARLWYAYADALLDAGREDVAREWFTKAAEVDQDGLTDAPERLLALDGYHFDDEQESEQDPDDLDDDDVRETDLDAEGLAALVAGIAAFEPGDDTGDDTGSPRAASVPVDAAASTPSRPDDRSEDVRADRAGSPFGATPATQDAVASVRPAPVPVVAFLPPSALSTGASGEQDPADGDTSAAEPGGAPGPGADDGPAASAEDGEG